MAPDVLIVEDEVTLAGNIRLFLERHHYDVRVAGTVAAGLKEYQEKQPDVVLLDILLPDGDGRRILRHIRHNEGTVGVIVMTAFGSVPLALDAMSAGADNYVEKPVPLDSLKLLIDRLIEQYRPPVARC